jgi:hypothetical protein
MADIYFSGRPSMTVMAQLYNGTNATGAPISLEEIANTGEYHCTVPAGTPAGKYLVVFFAGAKKLGSGTMEWDGAAEVLPSTIAAGVRAELAPELVNLDAPISTRSTLSAQELTIEIDAAMSADIAARVVNSQVEPGASILGSLKLLNAFVAGNVRGAGSNVEKFSNLAGTHDVIVSTNDANGNRRQVHLNLQD